MVTHAIRREPTPRQVRYATDACGCHCLLSVCSREQPQVRGKVGHERQASPSEHHEWDGHSAFRTATAMHQVSGDLRAATSASLTGYNCATTARRAITGTTKTRLPLKRLLACSLNWHPTLRLRNQCNICVQSRTSPAGRSSPQKMCSPLRRLSTMVGKYDMQHH